MRKIINHTDPIAYKLEIEDFPVSYTFNVFPLSCHPSPGAVGPVSILSYAHTHTHTQARGGQTPIPITSTHTIPGAIIIVLSHTETAIHTCRVLKRNSRNILICTRRRIASTAPHSMGVGRRRRDMASSRSQIRNRPISTTFPYFNYRSVCFYLYFWTHSFPGALTRRPK